MRCGRLVAATASLLALSSAPGAEREAASSCSGREIAAHSADDVRLPELAYECATLRNGQNILIGRGGHSHRDTVLLVHGLGSNAHRDWRKVIPELAAEYRVVTLDLPGFGESDTSPQGYSFDALSKLLAEILDRDSVHRAHVVGHSLGGAVALNFAYTYPQRVRRLVLVDAAGILLKSVYVHHVSQVSTPQLGFRPLDRLMNKVDSRINGVSRHVLQHLENKFDFSTWLADNPDVRVPLLGRFTRTDAALALIEHDFTRAIRETKAPTTIIWGRNDDVSPVRVGKLLAGRMPEARLHVIERTGHVPMNQSASEFVPLLVQALADPLAPKQTPELISEPRSIECHSKANEVYTGNFTTVTLDNCRDARIENARLESLSMTNSSAQLESVAIASTDIALKATNSFITATAVDLSGRIGVSADGSQLDLAGVSIRAREQSIKVGAPSRIYFSVSEIASPDFSGDVHEIWDDRARQRFRLATPQSRSSSSPVPR
jgi:pimeloyl-ACP methyl ester carboxylesterase